MIERKRRNAMKRLEKKALSTYRADWLRETRDQRILTRGNMPLEVGEDPDPLWNLIPAKRRLAEKMSRNSPLDPEEMRQAMYDMIALLTMDHSVFYLPGEEPEDGRCPECDMAMEECVPLPIYLDG